jgi:hypothetical protein
MNWKTVSTLVTMVALVGCQETVVAPIAPSSAPSAIRFAPAGGPQLSLSSVSTDNATSDFTVGPNGGLFRVGNHAVYFPAGSICDPKAAGYNYGAAYWDDQCAALHSSIAIHAVARTVNGQTAVDFSPSLRFRPSSNASRWVWLYMYTPSAINATDLAKYNILFVQSLGGAGIDESISDPTLRTYVDTRTGTSMRRIKHFTGYASNGYACDADPCQ